MRLPSLAFAAACGLAFASPGAALAGGLDLSGQPITLLFRDGTYGELTLGASLPHVEGTDAAGAASGNVYDDLAAFQAGFVRALGEDWSAGLVVDRPYAVRVAYDAGTAFPFAGTTAEARSLGVTALLRHRLDGRWSVHAGLRAERFGGDAALAGWGYGALAGYSWTGDDGWGFGYVVGAAFEVPEIALRVALTYGSEIEHELEATEVPFGPTTTPVTMPQSLNLDFQTGVAAGTLVYGLVRWVNWDGWKIEPAGLYAVTGLPLVEFTSDAFTWRLGLARQLTRTFAAAIEVTHETPKGQTVTALDPYDGFTTLGIGGTYTHPTGLEIGGGLGYTWLGDATAAVDGGPSARFAGNHAVGAQIRVGFAF